MPPIEIGLPASIFLLMIDFMLISTIFVERVMDTRIWNCKHKRGGRHI